MAVTTPFVLSGSLSYPPDTGEASADRPFSLAGSFTQEAEFTYVFAGAGTQTVDFGSISVGAKAILVEVDPDSSPAAAPVNITFNGGTDTLELTPGGFFCLGSPSPTGSGITSMAVAYTSACCVRVRVLG